MLAAPREALQGTDMTQPNHSSLRICWRALMGLPGLLLAGAVSGLALPPTGLWWLLGLTVPVLAFHLERLPLRAGRRAFLAGACFGFGYFAVAFHWIGYAFFVNQADIWMMPFAVGGLALFMALYWGAATGIAARVPAAIMQRWLAALLLIAVAEWLRGHLFTGFPWAVPGLVAEGMGPVAQVASLVGMNGLTALVLVWAVLPLVAWRQWSGQRQLPLAVLSVLMLLPLSAFWGQWRLGQVPTRYSEEAVVRLVQPNIAQDDKWRADNSEAIFSSLLDLTAAGMPAAGVTHVVWPESSVPFLLDEDPVALARIGDALATGRTLVAGAIRREKTGEASEPYFTSVLAIDDAGTVTGTYDKWRLVPGGEFLPFEGLLSRLGFRKVVSLPESFTAGPGAANLRLPVIGAVGALVCYEVIFPHGLVAAERPQMLINVTNDGWFGQSTGPYQHLAQARLRSIEQGLPVARAANTGISAMIDPVGRILIATQLGTRNQIDSKVPLPLAATPYARWGDGLLVLLLAALALLLRAAKLPDPGKGDAG